MKIFELQYVTNDRNWKVILRAVTRIILVVLNVPNVVSYFREFLNIA